MLREPNVFYIEDRPPKIVKSRKSTKRKKCSQQDVVKRRKRGMNSHETQLQSQQNIRRKKAYDLHDVVEQQSKIENTDPNDPLFTPQVELKSELEDDQIECKAETDVDDDYCLENKNEMSVGSDLDYAESYEEEVESDEDEPLIVLSQIATGKKRAKKQKLPRLHNCLETCKHKCTTKYSKAQRIDIFNYYCHLNKEDKVDFIRKHIRKPVLTRIRNKKRGNNCCYFLKYYKVGIASIMNQLDKLEREDDTNCTDNDDLTKVCRKFFEGTLGISNREIKEAIDGYELQQEKFVRPLSDLIKEDQSKLSEKVSDKTQRPQQFLDPETGNLTDTKPKKKAKRRKPGEPEPERCPRPINCAIRCIFKCHEHFSEEDRKQICDIFWSLDFKRRKDFILSRIETKDVETPTTPQFRKTNRPTRAYQTRFYLRSGLNSENKRVCKHFMMSTLCINRKFIENAIKYADKTTGNYVGVDGRGKHLIHKISPERKQVILDHINSYPIWMPSKKSKLRCLHHSLSIKRMYEEYREKCSEIQIKPVSAFYYYKVFHDEFLLLFLSNRESKKSRGFLNINPNISHYTGDEPGGCWLDSKGNQLDLRYFDPGQSLKFPLPHQQSTVPISCSSMDSTSQNLNQSQASTTGLDINQPLNFATAAAVQHLASFVDISTSTVSAPSINTTTNFQTTIQTLYEQ